VYLRRLIPPKSDKSKKEEEEKKEEKKNVAAPLISAAPVLIASDFEQVKLQINQVVSIEKQEIVTSVFKMAEDPKIQTAFLENEGFRNLFNLSLQASSFGTLALHESEEQRAAANVFHESLPSTPTTEWLTEQMHYCQNCAVELGVDHNVGTAGSVPKTSFIDVEIKKRLDWVLPTVTAVFMGMVLYRMYDIVAPQLGTKLRKWGVSLIMESFRSFLGFDFKPKHAV